MYTEDSDIIEQFFIKAFRGDLTNGTDAMCRWLPVYRKLRKTDPVMADKLVVEMLLSTSTDQPMISPMFLAQRILLML